MAGQVAGKVVLVTGASSGFGRHFAQMLAGEGATVVLAARRQAELEKAAAEIRAKGGTAHVVTLDVTDGASVKRAIAEATAKTGGIDVLVNNSGINFRKPALEVTEADWDAIVNTNLRGAFLMATEVARTLRDAKRPGSIINICSVLGLRQGIGTTPYASSKAGLIQMTKMLALDLAQHGIRVNAIAPGYFDTELTHALLASEAGQALVARIPMKRPGQVRELDGPLLLLASDASSFMTGSVIAVDGGHLVSAL